MNDTEEQNIRETLVELKTQFVELKTQFHSEMKRVTEILQEIKNDFVTRAEFETLKSEHATVKRIVYSAIGAILFAFLGSLIALVYKS